MAHGKESTEKILSIIHQPLTVPTTRSVQQSDMRMSKIGRICFRGDSRDFSKIFQEGFCVREGITQRLANKLKEIRANHLINASLFDSVVFCKEMEELKNLLQTDATQGFCQEFLALPVAYYDAWVNGVCSLLSEDGLVVMDSEQELQEYKQESETIISRPFYSHHMISSSKRFKSALMFPEYDESKPSRNRSSFLYAVYVEKGFDVHMHGVVSTMLNAKPTSYAELKELMTTANPGLAEGMVDEKIMQMQSAQKILNITLEEAMYIYAEEIISEMIPRAHVVAAISVQRKLFLQSEGFTAGTYELGDLVHINPQCTLSKETIDQVRAFLMEEIRLNKIAISSKQNPSNATIPEPEEGFKKGLGSMHKQ